MKKFFSSSSYAKTLTVFSLDALSQCAMNQNTGSLVIVYIAVLTSIFMSMLLFFFPSKVFVKEKAKLTIEDCNAAKSPFWG